MTHPLGVQPALTPEQWAEALSLAPGVAWGFGPATTGSASRHAVAAICLYGTPEGFTHEHVEALSRMLDQAERFGADSPFRADKDWWTLLPKAREAKDLIAALLPPKSLP